MHSALFEGIGVREYVLALIAGLWLADGIALLAAPQVIVDNLRTAIHTNTALWPWQFIAVMAGLVLMWAGLDLRYQPLWFAVAGGMVLKGCFLVCAPQRWRERVIAWSLGREDVDYRLWGLLLCTLAVLLLHALGWIGLD